MNASVQAKKQPFMPNGILVSESLSPIEKTKESGCVGIT